VAERDGDERRDENQEAAAAAAGALLGNASVPARNGTAWSISLARSAAPASYCPEMNENPDDPLADPPDQLRPFISHGRITTLPAKRSRRRLLLDQVVQAFEPGRRYPEAVVDEILERVFDDHCALRRYLIDEQFMSRTAAGVYWRAGGTVS